MAATLNDNALVTLDIVKGFLKIPSAVVSEDDLVRDFINEISSLIESYCQRKFRGRSYSERYDGARTPELMLKQWPIVAIVNMWEDSSRAFLVETLVDPANYHVLEDTNGDGITIERFDHAFSQGRSTVKVEYTAGYDAFEDVPGDLQLAAKRTIAYYWKQQQNEDFNETNKSKGDENVTLIDGIPKAASLILDNYKRWEMQAQPDPVRNM